LPELTTQLNNIDTPITHLKEIVVMIENQTTLPTPDQVTLTLDDLSAVLSIIDVATQRGAFRPKEFTAVGKVYEKISSFLEQVKDNSAPAADAGETADTPQTAE
jgi:hypothetical protein